MAEPGAGLAHGKAQRVAVAVRVDAQQFLAVAARLALAPQPAPARTVDAGPFGDRRLEALRVRVGEPERDAGLVADDRRPQPSYNFV